MNNLIVQKYGGSSLATLEQIDFVTKKIKKRLNDVNKIVIVVSAMGDTTDELVALSENFLKDNKDLENLSDFDQLLSTGEIISASLMSMSLRNNNVKAVSLTGQKAGIYTDELHGSARIASIDEKRHHKLRPLLLQMCSYLQHHFLQILSYPGKAHHQLQDTVSLLLKDLEDY